MRNVTSTVVLVLLAGFAAAASAAGCATAADIGDPSAPDAGRTTVTPTFDPDDADTPIPVDPPRDSGREDAEPSDAGFDAGPPAPKEGDPCTDFSKIIVAPCGACGKKEAVCLREGESATGKVSAYGACAGEVPNGCQPGTTEQTSCGNCGRLTRTCGNACAWINGQCGGEPAGACEPGRLEYSGAGCPANTYRNRECAPTTCVYSAFSATCDNAMVSLTLGAVGVVKNAVMHLSNANPGNRPASCYATASATGKNPSVGPYNRTIVAITNPHGTPAKAALWTAPAPQPGGVAAPSGFSVAVFDVLPDLADDNSLRECQRGHATSCLAAANVPCGGTNHGAIAGTSLLNGSFTVPAGGTVYATISSYDKTNAVGKITEGYFTLGLKVEAL